MRIVKNGIDRLDVILPLLIGKRVGLITNPTGINKEFVSTIDLLNDAGVLTCMFSPEHGVRGDLQAGAEVGTYTDSKTNLPVYSLYGHTPHFDEEMLSKFDVLAFDIQDVGARFYTYMYTLSYAMQDCAKAGKKVIVFDRINPVGGIEPQGTILDRNFASFVGRFPLATRYNLTIGEYANYINDSEDIHCDLTVVECEGWTRDCYYDETDLQWVAPSPNIPTIDSCIAYLGTCLAEGTNLSEGRGTTKPFEQIGAPWLDNEAVAKAMNALNMPGVKIRTCYFTPMFSKHANELCKGIQVHITDRHAFKPFDFGIRLYDCIRKTHKEFEFIMALSQKKVHFIDLLLGTDEFRKDDFDAEKFIAEQAEKCKEYEAKIKPYYLY